MVTEETAATRAEVGARVKAFRERKGWSQKQLVIESGVSQPNISAIEHGKQLPKPGRLAQIAKALGVTQDELNPARTPSDIRLQDRLGMDRTGSVAGMDRGKRRGMPPSLESFLARFTQKERITRRESQHLLESSGLRVEEHFVKDDEHWLKLLRFWREELRRQDSAIGDVDGQSNPS